MLSAAVFGRADWSICVFLGVTVVVSEVLVVFVVAVDAVIVSISVRHI